MLSASYMQEIARSGIAAGVRLLLVLLAMGTAPLISFADDQGRRTLVVADFDFRDTSGEVRNLAAEHQARLAALGETLETALQANAMIDVLALPCSSHSCSAREIGLTALTEQARASGAGFLLIGEVHKMSTLVGWVKYAVLDLGANKLVCDRFLTYRGDTREAWRRAAEFAARDISSHCFT